MSRSCSSTAPPASPSTRRRSNCQTDHAPSAAFVHHPDSTEQSRLLAKGENRRWDRKDSTEIINVDVGKTLGLDLTKHLAAISTTPEIPVDFYARFRSYQPNLANEQRIGERTINGQKLEGFRVRMPALTKEDNDQTWTFWVDPVTKLPVQVEQPYAVVTDIHFDIPLDDSLFAITVPPGYTLLPTPDAVQVAWDQFKYAGQVTDDHGKPIPDVEVTATERIDAAEHPGFGYIDVVQTNKEGRFSIDRPRAMSGIGPENLHGHPVNLEFRHPDFLYAQIGDVHLLSPTDLPRGPPHPPPQWSPPHWHHYPAGRPSR